MFNLFINQIVTKVHTSDLGILITIIGGGLILYNTLKDGEMDVIKKILAKLPKDTLVLLVIMFAGLYSNQKIKDNEKRQQVLIDTQILITKNQKTLGAKMDDGFQSLRTDLNEVKMKQEVVIPTLPHASIIMIDQIKDIYNQMRQDQSKKDKLKIDNENSYLIPIEPKLKEIDLTMTTPVETGEIKKNRPL
jgi:hypothetical protein